MENKLENMTTWDELRQAISGTQAEMLVSGKGSLAQNVQTGKILRLAADPLDAICIAYAWERGNFNCLTFGHALPLVEIPGDLYAGTYRLGDWIAHYDLYVDAR